MTSRKADSAPHVRVEWTKANAEALASEIRELLAEHDRYEEALTQIAGLHQGAITRTCATIAQDALRARNGSSTTKGGDAKDRT